MSKRPNRVEAELSPALERKMSELRQATGLSTASVIRAAINALHKQETMR